VAASLIKTQRFRLPTLATIRVLEPLSCRKYKLELKPGRKFSKILLKNNPNKELQAVWVCIAQDDIFMGHAITFYGVYLCVPAARCATQVREGDRKFKPQVA